MNESSQPLIARFTPATLNGSSVGMVARRAATEALTHLEVPHQRTEAWKYTNLRPLLKREFALALQPATLPAVPAIPGLDAHKVVFVNGLYQPALSSLGGEMAQWVKPINGLTGDSLAAFEQHFGSLIAPESGFFAALNTAYAKEGLFIHVPARKLAEKPLHIIHITDVATDTAMQVRLLVVVEEGASMQIVETFASAAGTQGTSLRIAADEAIVGDRASLTWVKVQDEAAAANHIGRTEVRQGNDSNVQMHTYTFGGQLVRNELFMHLDGRHCEAHLRGVCMLSDRQVCDNYTQVHHRQPDGHSNELYKGILDGHSRGVFNGLIHVYRDAQKTNAFQSNRNLLLTDTASMKTRPQLEIYADDVKCSHGAATGQLDEDALFYLQARGIAPADAKRLLVQAFVEEVVEPLTLEPVRAWIEARMEERV